MKVSAGAQGTGATLGSSPDNLHDHPGRDGLVGLLVDEDEAAGDAVAAVGVVEQRGAGAELHAADLVEAELAIVQTLCRVLMFTL